MKFWKYEATGNDFILIDGRGSFPPLNPEIIRSLCDRNRGIGADGIIVMTNSKAADLGMKIYNADGSKAEMCGNGIRAFYLFAIDENILTRDEIRVETLAGIRKVSKDTREGNIPWFKVDMGTPYTKRKEIPMKGNPSESAIGVEININGKTFKVTCLSMGNPHCVLFVEDVSLFDVNGTGPILENHPLFPNRTNVEFAQVIDTGHLRIRVWERGVGETLSCGTGACACLVAAHLNGLSERLATVELLGGKVEVDWRDPSVFLSGSARKAFSGEVFLQGET
ncbi:MAG: diaminopimelate epimerase [Actinomycetota bacterium]|nr:diaminopimelate epimerase [Actinomycetota bacterium]